MADGITIKWEGSQAVIEVLRDVARRVKERELLGAVRRGATIVLRAERASLKRRRTGLLGRSLGSKAKQRANGNVYAKIGARRHFRGSISVIGKRAVLERPGTRNIRLRKAALRMEGQIINPTKYAHLVEKGHQKGKGKSKARPYPFMKPAVESSRRAVNAEILEGIRRAIEKSKK